MIFICFPNNANIDSWLKSGLSNDTKDLTFRAIVFTKLVICCCWNCEPINVIRFKELSSSNSNEESSKLHLKVQSSNTKCSNYEWASKTISATLWSVSNLTLFTLKLNGFDKSGSLYPLSDTILQVYELSNLHTVSPCFPASTLTNWA